MVRYTDYSIAERIRYRLGGHWRLNEDTHRMEWVPPHDEGELEGIPPPARPVTTDYMLDGEGVVLGYSGNAVRIQLEPDRIVRFTAARSYFRTGDLVRLRGEVMHTEHGELVLRPFSTERVSSAAPAEDRIGPR